MSDIRFQLVQPEKLSLVKRFYKHAKYSAKTDRGDVTIVGLEGEVLVCAVRLQPKPWGFFLRAMVVNPSRRGQGIGASLLSWVVQWLQGRYCYCYALSHLEGFYSQGGFCPSDIDSVNAEIASHFIRLTEQGRDVVIMHLNDVNRVE